MKKLIDPIKIDIQITDVSNKCIRHIKKTTEIISLINYSLLNFNEQDFNPLDVDALPIGFDDPEAPIIITSPKEQALEWIFKKAFEEFIVGITESLIEAHKAANFFTFSNETKIKEISKDDVLTKIEYIKERPLKLFLPILINEIEKELNVELPFKEEILTINQVRNCLVHRNNIVSDKDINDQANNALTLVYSELVILTEKEGKIIELKKEDKKVGFSTNKIGIHTRKKHLSFKKGDIVKIDPTTFNNISLTCIQFVTNLLNKMPRPSE